MCSPYLVSLVWPMPGICRSAWASPGLVSAIAVRVASVRITNAGIFSDSACSVRHSISASYSFWSIEDGQSSQRPSLRAPGSVRPRPQTRHLGIGRPDFSERSERDGRSQPTADDGVHSERAVRTPIGSRKRVGPRVPRPPGEREVDQLMNSCCLARVTPT